MSPTWGEKKRSHAGINSFKMIPGGSHWNSYRSGVPLKPTFFLLSSTSSSLRQPCQIRRQKAQEPHAATVGGSQELWLRWGPFTLVMLSWKTCSICCSQGLKICKTGQSGISIHGNSITFQAGCSGITCTQCIMCPECWVSLNVLITLPSM